MHWIALSLRSFFVLASVLLSTQTYALFGNNHNSFLPADKAFRLESAIIGDQLQVRWNIAPGYYLYQNNIEIEPSDPQVQLAEMALDDTTVMKEDEYFGLQPVYYQQAGLSATVLQAAGATAEFTVTYQGCADAGLCYPPQKRTLKLDLPEAIQQKTSTPASAGSPSDTPPPLLPAEQHEDTGSAGGLAGFLEASGWPLIIVTFFALGIGLTFTPCVLPMIPILSGIVVGQRERPSTARAFVLSLSYVLGMAATYALAGVAVGYLGASANLQALMQQPLILGIFSLLFVALALSMFGLYELQLPAFVRDRLDALSQRQQGGQLLGVTLMGVLSALAVSPCVSAPLAGALLYISSTGDAVLGGGALFALAMGMGVPLLIIGTLGSRIIPKTGAWMERVKQAFGVLLLAVALWLLERVLPNSLALGLWGVLFIAIAIHLGALRSPATGWGKTIQAVGVAAMVWGIFTLWGAASGSGSIWKPISSSGQAGASYQAEKSSPFQEISSSAELEQALQTGLPLMLDFYADWCVSCIVMEEEIFTQPQVQALRSDIRFVQIDVTDFNSDHQATLDRYGLVGPPGILFFDGEGKEIEPARLIGEVTLPQFMRQVESRVLPEITP